ncbi:MAG: hypothetical protein GXP63_04340 [DPANN group archaeon]|nr:hypothetical protein [DPANN group archaeon]
MPGTIYLIKGKVGGEYLSPKRVKEQIISQMKPAPDPDAPEHLFHVWFDKQGRMDAAAHLKGHGISRPAYIRNKQDRSTSKTGPGKDYVRSILIDYLSYTNGQDPIIFIDSDDARELNSATSFLLQQIQDITGQRDPLKIQEAVLEERI